MSDGGAVRFGGLYPEVGAGGFSRVDGTVEFYGRVRALLRPDDVVLDLGAGRGVGPQEDPVAYRRALQVHQGHVARVIGADVDPVVKENPVLDEAIVLDGVSAPLPLDDASVDLVVSDFTFEHLDDPAHTAAELTRVLRPGGWICARTPNKWGYIGVGARLVPNSFHTRFLRRLQPDRKAVDVFPTRYRCNTLADVRRLFPEPVFEDCSYRHESEPQYAGSSRAAQRAQRAVLAVLPDSLASMLMIFVHKRGPGAGG
ncbi:MAG: methyltransferase domain-containing protein [Acidimicrobiales bacterium]|nr:methyltransferase domain-containing protein [Acidimicrobiales bacterium]